MEPSQRILVTGGAGYIGSHTVRRLISRGYDVVVVDDLCRGYAHNVDADRLRQIRLQDTAALAAVFAERPVDAVVHFAAFIAVGESVVRPELHFENNVGGSAALLRVMVEAGVKRLVFSSTAAVYGSSGKSPLAESLPFAPINPYGETKVMVEQMLRWLDQTREVRSIALRYFNAAGADPSGGFGEEHEPETHLIPLILRAIQSGKPIKVFGTDYPTPDGTCIRDYIHVNDLADAHIAAVDHLRAGGKTGAYNVGTGRGSSVLEVIRAAEAVTGQKVPFELAPRREGDPAELVADSTRLKTELGWTPAHSDLRDIIASAWAFESRKLQSAGNLV